MRSMLPATIASTLSGLIAAILISAPATPAFAVEKNLPQSVQSLVDQTLHSRWPQKQAFAPVTAVRQEKIDENASIYLVQINYQGFMMLIAQGESVRMVAYGQDGGQDLYPKDGALQNWLDALTQQIKKGPAAPTAVPTETAPKIMQDDAPAARQLQSLAPASIAPMTSWIWGQSGAYNDKTPPDGNTVPTGCVATALAQAMRYFQHPLEPKKTTISYNHQTTKADGTPFSYGVLSADLSQVKYNWDEMPDKVTQANSQVADLMYHLGVGLHMRYRPGFSSNAYFDDIPPAMRKYFGYDISDQIFRSSYNAENWQKLIQEQLQQQRVVVMCGYDYNAGAGHCWVVDGYDDKNFFRMNWGWDGRFNGYFSLSDPAVMGYDFGGYNHIFTLKPSCYIDAKHELLPNRQIRLSNNEFALNNTFAYRRQGDNAWIEKNTTQSSITLSGLAGNTTYEYKVASQCSKLGKNESALASFTTEASVQYCSAKGASTAYEWIESIKFGNVLNQSAANNGYADFSALQIDAKAGQALNLELKPGYSVQNPYLLYWYIWFDANNDGVFGSDEMIWNNRLSGAGQAQLNLPANLTAGAHRLRVVMSYYPLTSACAQYQYGEVEDYQLSIAP